MVKSKKRSLRPSAASGIRAAMKEIESWRGVALDGSTLVVHFTEGSEGVKTDDVFRIDLEQIEMSELAGVDRRKGQLVNDGQSVQWGNVLLPVEWIARAWLGWERVDEEPVSVH